MCFEKYDKLMDNENTKHYFEKNNTILEIKKEVGEP